MAALPSPLVATDGKGVISMNIKPVEVLVPVAAKGKIG